MSTNCFGKKFKGYLRPSAGPGEPTTVRQAEQAPTGYSSPVENFRFSTTDYCAVELASSAKLTQFFCEEGKSFSHETSQTLMLTQSTNIPRETIQIRPLLWY